MFRIFNKRPKNFSHKVEVKFDEILVFLVQGTLKTGGQIFSEEYVSKAAAEEWVYHVFNFEHNGIKYAFKVKDDERKYKYENNKSYLVYLDPDNEKACWFEGGERVTYLWEADEDDDDEWD